jgi:hypothetical protein
MHKPSQASFEASYPNLIAILNAVGDWLRTRGAARDHIRQLGVFSEDEMARVARDLKMSRSELRLAMALSPGFVDLIARRMGLLLARRLAALGLDRQQLRQANPPLLQALTSTCAGCAHHCRCEEDLDRVPDSPAWKGYCPNSKAIEALQAA